MENRPQLTFVIGLPRSGTKLLRDLLNNHSQIALVEHETQFIPSLYKKYSEKDLSDEGVFRDFYGDFAASVYAKNVVECKGRLLGPEEWREACGGFEIANVFRAFFERLLLSNGEIKCFGDKTPKYTAHVRLLKNMFPDAKFIHIVRDVRDRALSEAKVWNKSVYRSAYGWDSVLRRLQESIGEYPNDFIEVTYEALTSRPEDTLRDILNFLSLPWEDITTLAKSSENYGDARGATKPISGNDRKYRERLLPEVIKRMEEIAFVSMKRYNYPIEYASQEKPLHYFRLKFLAITDRLKVALFHSRDKGFVKGLSYFYQMKR